VFEYTLESVSKKKGGSRFAYFIVTSIIWVMVFIVSIIASIFLYDAHLDQQLMLITMLAPPPPPPPPPPPARLQVKQHQIIQPIVRLGMVSVRSVPKEISLPNNVKASYNSGAESEIEGVIGGVEGGVEGGVLGGVLGGVKGGVLRGVLGGAGSALPPPPPPPPKVEPPKPSPPPEIVRRSEGVIRGNAIDRIVPIYPSIARQAQIQGDIVVEILIDEGGNVATARILSGPALLQQAALTAARQWKFKPTMLNNVPVKVQGMLTFRFHI
jgi:periplasmic protein TonB